MKTKLLYSALIASCLVALSSCDPNDWNDKLDGFDGDKGITNKQPFSSTAPTSGTRTATTSMPTAVPTTRPIRSTS